MSREQWGEFSSRVNADREFASPILASLKYCLQESSSVGAPAANAGGRSSFSAELMALVRRPQRILFLWNWKAAWLSMFLRAPIFVAVAIRRGLEATLSSVLTECVFCMITAGFYGAIVQTLRDAEPEWLTLSFLVLVVPGVFQALEFVMHYLRGTPHLRIAELVSISVSGISALFNWYAMRRGVLLVGGEGATFGSDIRRLPYLLFKFAYALPLWIAQIGKGKRIP
jgi:hypothetical protein